MLSLFQAETIPEKGKLISMNMRKALVVGGVMAAALAVPATAASALQIPIPLGPVHGAAPSGSTATTSLTNYPVPLDGGNWALGTVTRTLTIRETGRGHDPAHDQRLTHVHGNEFAFLGNCLCLK